MIIKNVKFPPITMELYETDIRTLRKFMKSEKKEGPFTEEYLILYNFADDCRYSESIQPELVRYLLPFYFKIIEQAVIYENKVKYSFFQYLSVLLFKGSDNLLVMNEGRGFGMNDIWDFDNGYFTNNFFWSDAAVEFFDKEINRERIEALFHEINPFLCNILDSELVKLFCAEMNQSFASGVFLNRKAEYLKIISSKSSEYTYWHTPF